MHTSGCLKANAAVPTFLLPRDADGLVRGIYQPGLGGSESPPAITPSDALQVRERFGFVLATECPVHLLVFKAHPDDASAEDMRIPLPACFTRVLVPFDGWVIIEPRGAGECVAWRDDLATLDRSKDHT